MHNLAERKHLRTRPGQGGAAPRPTGTLYRYRPHGDAQWVTTEPGFPSTVRTRPRASAMSAPMDRCSTTGMGNHGGEREGSPACRAIPGIPEAPQREWL